MESNFNPYIHFSEKYLLRRLKRVEKIMYRHSLGKKSKHDIKLSRVLLLSVSDAINRKKDINLIQNMFDEDSYADESSDTQS